MWMTLFVVIAVTFVSCEEEVMKNLTTVTWAHAVNSKAQLESVLKSDIAMLEADVVLGQITGKEGPPIPVMAHPPASSSDLSLSEFLSSVAQHNKANGKQKGVKLDFKSIEAFEKAQNLIAPYCKPEVNFPVWLNADILPGPVESTTPPVDPVKFIKLASTHKRCVLSMGWTTRFGGNITEGEYSREQIGTMLRMIHENHVDQTVTFPSTTPPVDPVKFIKLASTHKRCVLSMGWTTRFGGNITEGEYSREQIGTMLRMIHENHVDQTVTFPLRASIASNSQPVVLDLLRETTSLNSSMTVWSSEGDSVEVDRLKALILTVGLERTYLDVPQELADRLKLPKN